MAGYNRSKRSRPGDAKPFMTVNIDVAKLNAIVDDVEQKATEAVRPAAQAGAQLIYEQARQNAQTMLSGTARGVLRDAIYHAFKDKESIEGMKAVYGISWNAQEAPHGHLVEYGHDFPYKIYFGKDGKYHTYVRPEKRDEFRAYRAAGKSIPKSQRDLFFVRVPGSGLTAPAIPFMRSSLSRTDDAVEKAKQVLFDKLGA